MCRYIWRDRREKKNWGDAKNYSSQLVTDNLEIFYQPSLKCSTFSPNLHIPQSHILFARTQKIRFIKSICNIFLNKSFKKHTKTA